MKKQKFVLVFLVFLFSSVLSAKPFIEEFDERLELNWGNLTLTFYGESKAQEGDNSLKEAEQAAWRDGLNYISEASKRYVLEKVPFDPETKKDKASSIAKNIVSSTISLNTVYYADWTVRVYLKNSLPNLYDLDSHYFSGEAVSDSSATKNSGLVFRIAQKTDPRAIYEIRSESGEVLFNSKKVSETVFHQNLMGRWFQSRNSSDFQKIAGANPIEVQVSVEQGAFKIARHTWEEVITGNEALLTTSRIAILVP